MGCKGCHKYHNKGWCFPDCNNKESHHKLSEKDSRKFGSYCKQCRGEWIFEQGSSDVLWFKKEPDKLILLGTQIQEVVNRLNGSPNELENVSKPVNLDPIQTGKVLRLALEGKSESDSNPIVLLDGFSSSTKDIQSRKSSSPTPASKVRFINSLDTGFRSKERDMRLKSSSAKIIKYSPLPPRPGIILVPRPSLQYYNTSWLSNEIGNLLKIKETFF